MFSEMFSELFTFSSLKEFIEILEGRKLHVSPLRSREKNPKQLKERN